MPPKDPVLKVDVLVNNAGFGEYGEFSALQAGDAGQYGAGELHGGGCISPGFFYRPWCNGGRGRS